MRAFYCRYYLLSNHDNKSINCGANAFVKLVCTGAVKDVIVKLLIDVNYNNNEKNKNDKVSSN